jgi:23S rRNA (adenine2503-C2)-methyltransferase
LSQAPSTKRPELLGMPRETLSRHLDAIGVGAKHTSRVFRGIHRLGLPLAEIPDLGRHAARIAEETRVASARVITAHDDADTQKLVIQLRDGARVEAVIIPMRAGRATLCVSSQVGCAMACSFCATGTMGLTRGLEAGEIVAQVHAARAWAEGGSRRISRIVFMGMGEPLHHYEATRDAVRVLIDGYGLSYGSRNVTVSTVGLVPRIRQFSEDFGGRVQLALSLHAGTDATRRRIIPTAGEHSMARLRQALLEHPLPGSRKLMIEYVVLPGVNDTPEEIDALASWMKGLSGVVNLIPFNPFSDTPYRSPTQDEVLAVYGRLQAARVPATVRWPRGRRAHGACGQLALAHERSEHGAS